MIATITATMPGVSTVCFMTSMVFAFMPMTLMLTTSTTLVLGVFIGLIGP
nr:hypothetical protein [Nesterenkonia alkaliphila]